MKIFLLALIFVMKIASAALAQSNDEIQVSEILNKQVIAWNNGELKDFMQGYWQSDSLKFIGKSGITFGWNNTLNNYIKSYPDTAAMGKLAFNIIEVKKLSSFYIFVIGKWQLTRSIGDLSGHFTLLFKKIKNKWLIIADHSS